MVSCLVGCGPSGGDSVAPPTVDTVAASAKAIELYDTDGDSSLSKEELEACPGLLSGLPLFDADRDGKINQDEIQKRLDILFMSGVGLTSVNCTVRKGGAPVPGVWVSFVPEEFLGDSLQIAMGLTDRGGNAKLAVADENLPDSQQGLNMMQVGIYRVEITTGPDQIAKTRQIPGFVVDPTSRAGGNKVFDITSR